MEPNTSQRLALLRGAAKNWLQGRWGYRSQISGTDEVAQLSRTLDQVAGLVEAQLRAMERQAKTLAEQAALLDLAHDAILVWDLRTGAIRFWNRGAEELYGWPRAE